SVTFSDMAAQPNTSAVRIATIRVNDAAFSTSVSGNVKVFKYLSGLGPVVHYVHGTAPQSIAPNLVVTPPQGLHIVSATVTFASWQAEDRLAFTNSLGLHHTFTQNFTDHTATLTFTGTAT